MTDESGARETAGIVIGVLAIVVWSGMVAYGYATQDNSSCTDSFKVHPDGPIQWIHTHWEGNAHIGAVAVKVNESSADRRLHLKTSGVGYSERVPPFDNGTVFSTTGASHYDFKAMEPGTFTVQLVENGTLVSSVEVRASLSEDPYCRQSTIVDQTGEAHG